MNRGFIGSLCLSVTFALLAGCGGSQPPIGAPGAMPHSGAIAQHAAHGESWMLPDTVKRDLLYVSDFGNNSVDVYTYPDAQLVGTLVDKDWPGGECVDGKGDVFVISRNPTEILEYPHGGKKPIAKLKDGVALADSCSVNPINGDLAVANTIGYSNDGGIAIYTGARGSPQILSDPRIPLPEWVTYDGRGNLYILGKKNENHPSVFGELHSGKFRQIELNHDFEIAGPALWHKGLLDVGDLKTKVYQFKMRGQKGTQVNSIPLNSVDYSLQFSIYGDAIIAAHWQYYAGVMVWRYPGGGNPIQTISGFTNPYAAVVSPAQN